MMKKGIAAALAVATAATMAAGLAACGEGATGATGASAYDIWLAAGNTGSESDFLASLKGATGANGTAGSNGASAYDIWLAAGNTGSEEDFLASLKGEDGSDGVCIQGVYETSEGTFVCYTDGTYAAVETGGARYELLMVGENNITLAAPNASWGYSITAYSFYILNGGTYTITVENDEAGVCVLSPDTTITSNGELYMTSGGRDYGTVGVGLEEAASGSFTLDGGLYTIFAYNVASTAIDCTVTIEKTA